MIYLNYHLPVQTTTWTTKPHPTTDAASTVTTEVEAPTLPDPQPTVMLATSLTGNFLYDYFSCRFCFSNNLLNFSVLQFV